jgi:CDP-4-dehydro-6-deoxyglucose reductase, E1
VEIRPIIAGNIGVQPFFKKYVSEPPRCPNAELVHTNGFYCANNAHLTTEEVDFVCALVRSAVAE